MSKVCVLRNVPLFEGLSDQALISLANSLKRKPYRRGDVIFHQDDPGQTMYIIESGKVRIFVLGEFGQEISINVYSAGDTFGELAILDGLPRSAGAVALEKTVTLTLQRADFLCHLKSNPEMAQSVIEVLSARLRYTTVYVEQLTFLSVKDRVAAKLLELAERYGVEKEEGVEIGLKLTQAELASWVGATRESVNDKLGIFRDQGVIKVRGQKITILDRQGLKGR